MKKKSKKAKQIKKAKKLLAKVDPSLSIKELNSYLSISDTFDDEKLNKSVIIARMLRLVDLEKEVSNLREKAVQLDDLAGSLKKVLKQHEMFDTYDP